MDKIIIKIIERYFVFSKVRSIQYFYELSKNPPVVYLVTTDKDPIHSVNINADAVMCIYNAFTKVAKKTNRSVEEILGIKV